MPALPGTGPARRSWQAFFAGKGVATEMTAVSRELKKGEPR
jgi:hypothetical protein